MTRPQGVVGRKQLKQEDLIRIQVLHRDARMGPSEIMRITGYSIHQVKYALKKKSPTVGIRTGRPRKGEKLNKNGGGEGAAQGSSEDSEVMEVDRDGDQTEQAQPSEPSEPVLLLAKEVLQAAQPHPELERHQHLEQVGQQPEPTPAKEQLGSGSNQ
ncbi:hypothetical protein N658DRAFT_486209 [Parathielavia hyrcaniae]|uniref:Transposase n=1 Tax=Parathielavia hyrcaniae TaxID=113614 RepID=A0AAN6Q0C5_9PEZI|nr:hypothetical protein N658DRAFT_486209 [Parathielavia hyrcaniae]